MSIQEISNDEKLRMQEEFLPSSDIVEQINIQLHMAIESNEGSESVMPTCAALGLADNVDRIADVSEGKKKFDAAIIAFADLPPTHKERAQAFEGLGAKLVIDSDMKPVLAIFTFEAWLAAYKTNEEQKEAYKKYGNSLKDHPGSTEVFVCSGMTLDGRTIHKSVPFTRDSENNIVFGNVEDFTVQDIFNPFKDNPETSPRDFNLTAFFKGVAMASTLKMIERDKDSVPPEILEALRKMAGA